HDEHVVDRGRQGGDHALDDRPSAQLDQRLGLPAHAHAPSPGLDDAGDLHDALAPRDRAVAGGATMSRTTTAPWRSTRRGAAVRSSTVEGSPPRVAPPSRTRSTPSPK